MVSSEAVPLHAASTCTLSQARVTARVTARGVTDATRPPDTRS